MDNVWNTMPWVEEQLESLGIPPPREPEHECPIIAPGTLTGMSSSEYTTTYEKLLGWYGYLNEKTAYAKSMVLQCENEIEYIAYILRKTAYEAVGPKEKKPSEKQIDINIELDPRHSELKLISQKWRQLRDGLQARLDTVDANMKVVSRHIEIRKLDQEGARHQGNMAGRNRPYGT